MRKSIIMLSLAILGAFSLRAETVSPQQAEKVAFNYVARQPGASPNISVDNVEMIGSDLYLVNFAPKGFAIVAADDTSDPIIGYSTESSMSVANMPENMRFMVDEAGMGVKARKATTTVPNKRWASYAKGQVVLSRAGDRVEPLITVNWNQSAPYNKYCPGEGNKKAVVGCVAVAMSQAMSVQRFPLKPLGRKSYNARNYGTITINYDEEAPYDWNAIIAGTNGKDEVARLLYHAGVSVGMGYGSDGSGIPSDQVYLITDALKEHFGYGSDVKYTWRSSYRGDWEQLLLNELYADRAMVYNAIDSKGGYGHSFNIDGYDGDSKYHVNWGWGGYGDGYFGINALKDAQMNMNYDTNHVVVTGIGGGNSAFRSLQLTDLTAEANKPAGSYVSAILVNGEPVDDSQMLVSLSGPYNAATGAYEEVPFRYKNGLIVSKREFTEGEGPFYVRFEVVLKKDYNTKLRQGFNIAVEPHKTIDAKTSVTYDRDTKTFTVHTKYGAEVHLKDATGAEVLITKDPILPNYTFSRDNLTTGTNKLEVSHEGETKVVNIVK